MIQLGKHFHRRRLCDCKEMNGNGDVDVIVVGVVGVVVSERVGQLRARSGSVGITFLENCLALPSALEELM